MGQKTVLVVDDSNLAIMMVQKIVSQSFPEWTVLTARNGEEGLAVVAAQPLDVVLLDFNMPGLNGIDLAVKLMEIRPSLAIFLVTANIQPKMQERAEALGIGFVKKPINKEKCDQILT